MDRFFSHRAHRVHGVFWRTVSSPQNASGIQSSQSVTANVGTNKGQQVAYILFIGVSRWLLPSLWGRGRGRGHYLLWMLCVLFICVILWEIERTHSMRWHTNNSVGRFFSHRTHRFNRTFLRTVSNSQKASGIQNSQNVSAKGGCWVMVVRCWWLAKDGCKVLWNRLT